MTSLSEHAVFQAVARHRSFSQAARELAISRSYASRVIARLEERLGAKLFVRTTRQVNLTDAGLLLLQSTSHALESLAAAEAQIQEAATVLRGPIRCSLPLEFGALVLAPVLVRFQVDNPHIELHIELGNTKVDLHSGRHDIAVRGGVLEDSSLHARRLRTFRLCTVASPAYLARHGRPSTPAELSHHACLAYTLNHDPHRWLFESAGAAPLWVPIQSVMSSDSPAVLIEAAAAGIGIARQPDFLVADHIETGRLVDVLEDTDTTEHAFFAVVPSRALMPARLRALLDFLVAALQADDPAH